MILAMEVDEDKLKRARDIVDRIAGNFSEEYREDANEARKLVEEVLASIAKLKKGGADALCSGRR